MLADRPTQDLGVAVGSVLHDPLWFYWVQYGDDLFVVCARSVDEVHEVVQERARLAYARSLEKHFGEPSLRVPALRRLYVTRVADLVEE